MKKLVIATLISLTATAWAQTAVKVEDAWVRGTVATQKASGAFMKLTASAPMRLVGVSSPVAGVVEIHEMAMDKDIMVMRETQGIDLPAGRAVELKPGGYHVMLMDLKQPLKAGESVALTLSFEDAAKKRFTQDVQAAVVPLGAKPAAMPHGSGHKH
jgi:periplasmic copper chaperone A